MPMSSTDPADEEETERRLRPVSRAERRRRQREGDLPVYIRRILEAHRLGAIPTRPGVVSDVFVWHEPECRRPQGGPCTCRPDQLDIEARVYPRGGAQ